MVVVPDLDEILDFCAREPVERVLLEDVRENGETFRRRTRAQIEESRSWVWRERDTILFKAEASTWTPEAVQIQQVWVDPAARGNGYAQRGMRDLCRLLLRRVPRVSLFVWLENAPAIRVYEAIGMRRALTFRSIIFG